MQRTTYAVAFNCPCNERHTASAALIFHELVNEISRVTGCRRPCVSAPALLPLVGGGAEVDQAEMARSQRGCLNYPLINGQARSDRGRKASSADVEPTNL